MYGMKFLFQNRYKSDVKLHLMKNSESERIQPDHVQCAAKVSDESCFFYYKVFKMKPSGERDEMRSHLFQ